MPWRREIGKLLWDAPTYKAIGKGKAQIGNMDVLPRDAHQDTWIERYIIIK